MIAKEIANIVKVLGFASKSVKEIANIVKKINDC